MIKFLPEVNPHNVHPAIWMAVGLAYCRHRAISGADMIVTSMNDGKHENGSYHYPASTPTKMCQAVDMRTFDLFEGNRKLWAEQVKTALDPLGFDIVLHDGSDGLPLHLHIEWQPKSDQEREWMKGLEVINGPHTQEGQTNTA